MLHQAPDLLLHRLERLACLPGEARAALRGLPLHYRQLDARACLYEEGSPATQVHVVVDGVAARYKLMVDGMRQITAYLVPGDLDDPFATLRPVRDHGLVALTPVLVAGLDGEALREVAGRHGAVMDALCHIVLAGQAMLGEWMVNIGRRPADQRVAHLLCELRVRLGAVGLAQGSSFVLPISQIDLADTVGISAVHANRIMQQLRQEGLISLDRRVLTIPDPAALAAYAGFRPGYLGPGHLGSGHLGSGP